MEKKWKALIIINTVLIIILYAGVGIAGYYGYSVVESFRESFGISAANDTDDEENTAEV